MQITAHDRLLIKAHCTNSKELSRTGRVQASPVGGSTPPLGRGFYFFFIGPRNPLKPRAQISDLAQKKGVRGPRGWIWDPPGPFFHNLAGPLPYARHTKKVCKGGTLTAFFCDGRRPPPFCRASRWGGGVPSPILAKLLEKKPPRRPDRGGC